MKSRLRVAATAAAVAAAAVVEPALCNPLVCLTVGFAAGPATSPAAGAS